MERGIHHSAILIQAGFNVGQSCSGLRIINPFFASIVRTGVPSANRIVSKPRTAKGLDKQFSLLIQWVKPVLLRAFSHASNL